MRENNSESRAIPLKITAVVMLLLAVCTIFSAWTQQMMLPEVMAVKPDIDENGMYTLPLDALQEGNIVIALQEEATKHPEKQWAAAFVQTEHCRINPDETFTFRCSYPPTFFITYSSRMLVDREVVILIDEPRR